MDGQTWPGSRGILYLLDQPSPLRRPLPGGPWCPYPRLRYPPILYTRSTLSRTSPLVYYLSYCVNFCVVYLVLSRVRMCEANRRSRFSSPPPLLPTSIFSPLFHFICATLWRPFTLSSVHFLPLFYTLLLQAHHSVFRSQSLLLPFPSTCLSFTITPTTPLLPPAAAVYFSSL